MGYEQQLAERADLESPKPPDEVRAAFLRVVAATTFWTGPVRVLGDDEDGVLLEIRGGLPGLIKSGLSGFGRQMLVHVSIAPYLEGSQIMITIADATIAQFKVFMFVPMSPKRVIGMSAYRHLVATLRHAVSAPAPAPPRAPAPSPSPTPEPRPRAQPSSVAPPPPRPGHEPPPMPSDRPAPARSPSPAPTGAAPRVRLTKETVTSPLPEPPPSRPAPPIRPVPLQRSRRPLVIGAVAVLVACAGGIGIGVAMMRDDSSSTSLATPSDATGSPASGDTPGGDAVDPTATSPPIPEPVAQGPPGPSQILRRHLQRLNSHDYDDAFELMSASYRSKVPTWVDVRSAAKPLINVVEIGKPITSETAARVPITFYARDTVDVPRSDTICRRFDGTAHMIKDGSDWYYDPLSNALEVTALADGHPDCP